MKMSIKKIILTADFLRQPQLPLNKGGASRNMVWFTSLPLPLIEDSI